MKIIRESIRCLFFVLVYEHDIFRRNFSSGLPLKGIGRFWFYSLKMLYEIVIIPFLVKLYDILKKRLENKIINFKKIYQYA